MTTTEQKERARKASAARKTFGAGSGRPRKVKHIAGTGLWDTAENGNYICVCVDCRKSRGHYPDTKWSTELKSKKTKITPKSAKPHDTAR